MRTFIWLGCLAYFINGLAHVAVGSVLEELLGYYGKAYKDGGSLIFLQFSGLLVGVLIGPWWSRRLGRKGAMLLALCCLIAGETVYTVLPPWSLVLMAAPIAGFGFGMLEALIGSAIIEFVEERKAVAMSKVEVFFGVGAMALPAAASLLIRLDLWRLVFPIIAVLALTNLLLFKVMSFGSWSGKLSKGDGEPTAEHAAQSSKKPVQVHRAGSRIILIFMSVFFLIYVGLEMSFVNFLPSFLIEKNGVASSVGAAGVSFFWASMVAGRLFSGILAEKLGYKKYLYISGLGALAVFSLFYISGHIVFSFGILLFMGLFLSGIFAIGLLYANSLLPGTEERTTSLLIASGGIGGAVIPLLTGIAMDAFTASYSIAMLIGMMLLMMVVFYSTTKASGVRAKQIARVEG